MVRLGDGLFVVPVFLISATRTFPNKGLVPVIGSMRSEPRGHWVYNKRLCIVHRLLIIYRISEEM